MVENNDIVQYVYDNKMVDKVLCHFPKHFSHYDEIRSYIFFTLLEYDPDKLRKTYEDNHLYALINRIARLSISPESGFWRNEMKYRFRAMELTEEDENKL